jgi:glycogen synthase
MPGTAPRALTIALVTPEYPPDNFSSGIGSYTKAMADALVERGHRVHVVSRASEPETRVQNGEITVHRVTPFRPEIPKTFTARTSLKLAINGLPSEFVYRSNIAKKLNELVEREGVDLIEAADHAAEASRYAPRKHPRVPFIVRLHAPVAVGEVFDRHLPESVRRAVRLYERRFLRKATHLSAPSESAWRIMSREMGIEDIPVTVLPNPPTYNPTEVEPSVPEETDPNLILFVGRITKWKGVHLLVQAMPHVLERHPAARLELIGTDAFSVKGFASMRDYLRSLIPMRYHASLHFLGRLPHNRLVEHYRRAAICVFPSLYEAFGYTCLEAMTYGKAIVAGAQGGMSELLDSGRCGLLFEPPDIGALGEAITGLLGDPGLRERLGAAARARVLKHYSREAVMERTLLFYRVAITECKA